MASPALKQLLEQLRHNPDATLEEVRERAALEGRRIHAETYRRARIELGLDPQLAKPVAPATPSPASSSRGRAQRRGASPRSRTTRDRTTAVAPLDHDLDLDRLQDEIQAIVDERDRLHDALRRMRDVLQRALD